MLNLATTYFSAMMRDKDSAGEGCLGKLIVWARQKIRYERALNELHRLDERDLDDLGIARGDFPALAWRHATGAEPLQPRYS